jgi:hypothetical protein
VTMATHHPKRPRDPNRLGKIVVYLSIGDVHGDAPERRQSVCGFCETGLAERADPPVRLR